MSFRDVFCRKRRGSAGVGFALLVSGTVTPTSGQTLQQVAVGNGSATVDAAGDFFANETTGLGTTTTPISATDSGGSATTSVSVTGTAPVTPSALNPTAIDFSLLSDVTAAMTVSYGQTSFNEGTSIVYANDTATNQGDFTIGTPLVVGVQHISAPSVRVRDNTGQMADGTPFYDLSSLVSGNPPLLTPGGSIQTGTLAFYDPEGIPFTYTLIFLGHLNHPPRFTSVPVVQVEAGQRYAYTTTGADPDNDYLTFSVVAGPAGMAFTDAHAGTLTWSPSAAGTYSVHLRVSDNKGGTADQSFVITVLPTGINYPPVFTSSPPVEAYVGMLYSYAATVSDQDHDSQTFSLVSAPRGMTINPSTGLVQWTPAANQVSSLVGGASVTIQDTDAGGLSVQQSYVIWTVPTPGNDPPLFVTTPVTSVASGQLYVYPSQAVDDDKDAISYTLTAGPGFRGHHTKFG